jgi:ferritin
MRCVKSRYVHFNLICMNMNRLSEKINKALNDQMTKEAHASQIFLSYGAWADSNGFGGIANFLFRHAQEERNHMMKILEYILKRGGTVKVSAIDSPPSDPVSITDCFEKIFKHEVDNTQAIYGVVTLTMNEQDWATWNFMQWFVKEQTEEETLALELLDKVKIAGGIDVKGNSLYTLDRDLEKAPDDARLAQDVTAVNP